MKAQTFIQHISNTIKKAGIVPSPFLNFAFSFLVTYLRKHNKENPQSEIQTDNTMMSHFLAAESALEKDWAIKIEQGKAQLEDYPYYQEHLKVSIQEIESCPLECFQQKTRIHIVGAGALPLTALCLYALGMHNITCSDKDPQAVTQGSKVLNTLLPPGTIQYKQQELTELQTETIDTLIITGGVITNDKTKTIKALLMEYPKQKRVVVRTGRKAGRLLYPDIRYQTELKNNYLTTINHELMKSIVLKGDAP